MKKNNFWNRTFHRSEVLANKRSYEIYKMQLENGPEFITALKNAKDLRSILAIHKDAYGSGFEHPNIGPCSTGMFRCQSIETMTPHQVYLGGIYGLNTNAIPFWEQYVDEPYGVNGFGIDENTSLYGMILNQYKEHLISNISGMYNIALKESITLKELGYEKDI